MQGPRKGKFTPSARSARRLALVVFSPPLHWGSWLCSIAVIQRGRERRVFGKQPRRAWAISLLHFGPLPP
eukprot:13819208-Alexandrium_andersonii.AAC.1